MTTVPGLPVLSFGVLLAAFGSAWVGKVEEAGGDTAGVFGAAGAVVTGGVFGVAGTGDAAPVFGVAGAAHGKRNTSPDRDLRNFFIRKMN